MLHRESWIWLIPYCGRSSSGHSDSVVNDPNSRLSNLFTGALNAERHSDTNCCDREVGEQTGSVVAGVAPLADHHAMDTCVVYSPVWIPPSGFPPPRAGWRGAPEREIWHQVSQRAAMSLGPTGLGDIRWPMWNSRGLQEYLRHWPCGRDLFRITRLLSHTYSTAQGVGGVLYTVWRGGKCSWQVLD
jgi:hypothetical protein